MPIIVRIFPILFIIFFLFFNNVVNAQESGDEEDYEYQRLKLFELTIDIAFPISTFEDKMNSNGIGFNSAILFQTSPQKPIFWGIGGYFHHYFSIGDVFADVIDNQLIDIDRRTSVNTAGADLLLRYYPTINLSIFEPFVEGHLGSTFLFTYTRLLVSDTGENLDFYFEETDFNFSYGLSAGFQINLHDYRYYLNFKGTYSSGTSATFLARESGTSGSGRPIDQLEIKNAPIDLMRFQMGITFAF